jgi:hypothetical protein
VSPDIKTALLMPISDMVDHMVPCGSRVTCDPPPMDTDEDYLLYIGDKWPPAPSLEVISRDERWFALEKYLYETGWKMGGSLPNDVAIQINPSARFTSWTFEEINLIITISDEFYRRHQAASNMAKRLNLLEKADRIALFQAVLYGNIVDA